jgi:hypothetical protein
VIDNDPDRYAEIQEGDDVLVRAKVARANADQALLEITSSDGPLSVRVPLPELSRPTRPDEDILAAAGLDGLQLLDPESPISWEHVARTALEEIGRRDALDARRRAHEAATIVHQPRPVQEPDPHVYDATTGRCTAEDPDGPSYLRR